MTAQQFIITEHRIEKVDGTINCSALEEEDKRKDNTKYSSFHDIFLLERTWPSYPFVWQSR